MKRAVFLTSPLSHKAKKCANRQGSTGRMAGRHKERHHMTTRKHSARQGLCSFRTCYGTHHFRLLTGLSLGGGLDGGAVGALVLLRLPSRKKKGRTAGRFGRKSTRATTGSSAPRIGTRSISGHKRVERSAIRGKN